MFKNTTISVPSIMCEMCVTTVTDTLKKVDGVNNKVITDAGYDAIETPRNREA